MEKVRLRFADLEIAFVDRDRVIKQIEELAEGRVASPIVIYGPEGCGKTALFRQAKEVLEEHGYAVTYFSPLEEKPMLRLDVSDSVKGFVSSLISVAVGESGARFVDRAMELVSMVMRYRDRVAILADDIFYAVGLDRAEIYVKAFLNLIEYPPTRVERIIVLVSSSEGVTKNRIGRHSWARIMSMWNMSRDGFRELYDQIPGDKPGFEDIWSLTGGNPRYLAKLYEARWNIDSVIDEISERRELEIIVRKWWKDLERTIEDPDYLWDEYHSVEELVKKLIELNMVCETVSRKEYLWIDVPPPERDVGIGIGRRYAWQTPIHREAVRRILNKLHS